MEFGQPPSTFAAAVRACARPKRSRRRTSSGKRMRSSWPAARALGLGPPTARARGGGPGLRETEALAPENLVGQAHAVVLAGGSVFGLAAADGVAAALSAKGAGIQLRRGAPPIPIVPAAVLHDLANGGDKTWGMSPPYRVLGIESLEAAAAGFRLLGLGRGAHRRRPGRGELGRVGVDAGRENLLGVAL